MRTHRVFAARPDDLGQPHTYPLSLGGLIRIQSTLQYRDQLREHSLSKLPDNVPQSFSGDLKKELVKYPLSQPDNFHLMEIFQRFFLEKCRVFFKRHSFGQTLVAQTQNCV